MYNLLVNFMLLIEKVLLNINYLKITILKSAAKICIPIILLIHNFKRKHDRIQSSQESVMWRKPAEFYRPNKHKFRTMLISDFSLIPHYYNVQCCFPIAVVCLPISTNVTQLKLHVFFSEQQ